jgi:hypothetical protein
LVIAPVLEWIIGDHRAGEAQAGGALQLSDPYSMSSRLIIAMMSLSRGGTGAAARTSA